MTSWPFIKNNQTKKILDDMTKWANSPMTRGKPIMVTKGQYNALMNNLPSYFIPLSQPMWMGVEVRCQNGDSCYPLQPRLNDNSKNVI